MTPRYGPILITFSPPLGVGELPKNGGWRTGSVRRVLLRDLTTADLDAMTTINAANVPAVGENTREDLAEILDMSVIALGTEVDGALAGFCLVVPPGQPYWSTNYEWFSARYDDFVYLDRVAFAAEHQGRGLGSEMYAEVERRASAPWFLLEVNLRPRNEGSLRFHARHGFVEVGQQETNYGSLVSLLAKPLG